jgi:cleavage and polyadenylation specificity factor subunit 1
MLNFYRRFLPHAAATQAPLHDVLSGPRVKGSNPITSTPELLRAFEECKASLSRATLLGHPDPSAPLALVTDTSTSAMGGVLQRVKNAWLPLAFFLKKLNPAQQKYPAYDRELLAIYEAVKHFRHMVEACNFIICTDKPITYAFPQKRDKCSPREFNHLDFVAQFTTDIRHIYGQDNVVDDALSHVESVTAPPSYDALAASQDSDDELRTLLGSTTALRLEKPPIPVTTVSIYCDTSTGSSRPYVPAPLRLQVFQSVHDLSHPGTRATAKLVAERFVWPGVQNDCRIWARACESCQCSKVSRHTFTPLGDFIPPASGFLHVHVYLVGPLPTSMGYTCCLTAVDRFTRWPDVVSIPDNTADTSGVSRFGCPQTINKDQERQFEFQLSQSLARLCGIQLSRMTAHHPAANGLMERFHRTLKAAIMCHADRQWTEELPLVSARHSKRTCRRQ